MTATMLFTMVLCFALSISVAVAIGLAVDRRRLAVERQPADHRQGDVRRDQQVPAGGDSVLHPRRQPDGNRRHLDAPGRVRQVDRRRRAGRPRRHLRADLHDLRRGVGLERGDDLRHRRHPDPGADPARLPDQLRRGAAGDLGGARRDHPAVDPDDPLRRVGRSLDRRALHRRLRPGPADRRRADAVRRRLRPLEGLRQEGPRGPAAVRRRDATRGAGAADAGDHPRRHLRRHLHADRGVGRRGVLRADRRRAASTARRRSPTCRASCRRA